VADTTYDDSPEDFGPADESGGSFGFQVGFEAPQDALGCYYWDGVEDAIYASDECDLDGSIFDFAGNQNPLAPDTVMAATTVALPQAFEYEDPTLEVDGEDFYWATGPPLPDDTGQTTSYYPDQDIDDPEPESYGTFGNFQRPADLVASQILGGTFPDDDPDADADELDTGSKFDYQLPLDDTGETVIYYPDEPLDIEDDEDYGFASFLIGTEAYVDPGGESVCYTPDDTFEDEETSNGSFGFAIPPDALDMSPILNPVLTDEDEELDELDAGSRFDFQIPGDDTGQTIIYWPDEADEPEDEPAQQVGGIVGSETVLDTGGQTIVYCPDEPEEPDDEQFGSESFLVGVEAPILSPYAPGQESYPAEAEEPEDEDFGFASLFQLPSDDTGQTIVYEPDEIEEPEDELFDWVDSPRPADYFAPQPLTLWQFPDEAEEPEDEPFDFALAPLALDDAGQSRALFEDEPEEPEDEDYGLASFLLPPDALPNVPTCYYPDESEEPEEEPYGLHDLQIPQSAVSDCPPQNTWHEPGRPRVWHIGRI